MKSRIVIIGAGMAQRIAGAIPAQTRDRAAVAAGVLR